MFKTTLAIVMATLCLFFRGQAQDNKAIEVTAKGIQIGQQVPDIAITNLHNYEDKNGEPATSAKISDFKGKLLILDFWATWCSPCVAMIPKMNSLQKQFGDKIQFLSVTYQTEKEVLPFLEKFEKQKGKHYDLPVVTGDKELRKSFPHIYLPHYVWIDKNGIVTGITNYNEVDAENISKVLSGKPLNQAKKRDYRIPYLAEKPFLINSNGGSGENLLYHSLLTGHTEGLPAGFSYTEDNQKEVKSRRIVVRNLDLRWLYRLAFSDGKKQFGVNRFIADVNDHSKLLSDQSGDEYRAWIRQYGYCYELILPPEISSRLFKTMQDDLARIFPQYHAGLETRQVKCWALTRTSKADKIHSKGEKPIAVIDAVSCNLRNVGLSHLIMRLNEFYMQNSTMPLVDATGYTESVDLTFNANMDNMIALNNALTQYDLKFIEKTIPMEMIVVKDATNTLFTHPNQSKSLLAE